ncbi:MAG: hypothetical protein ACHQQ3_12145 [Gemmatimonadales bacterium]
MREKTLDMLWQGLFAGFLGFMTIILVFAVANVGAGRSPFYTAAVLGATLFYGVTDLSQMATTIAPYVFAYTGLHLMAFLIFGLAGSVLATIAERGAILWYPGIFFFLFVGFHMIGAMQLLAQPIESALSSIAVWVAGMLASGVMAAYLLLVHPDVRRQLTGWYE